jgi:hypothetical protein
VPEGRPLQVANRPELRLPRFARARRHKVKVAHILSVSQGYYSCQAKNSTFVLLPKKPVLVESSHGEQPHDQTSDAAVTERRSDQHLCYLVRQSAGRLTTARPAPESATPDSVNVRSVPSARQNPRYPRFGAEVKWLFALKLAEVILLAAPSCAAPRDAILARPDVVKSIAQIRHDTFGPLHIEYALLVRQHSTDFVAGSGDGVVFKWDDSIIAVIHTHPDRGFEHPSLQDVKTAVDNHRPVYVVSVSEIWEVSPTGEISCVSSQPVQ